MVASQKHRQCLTEDLNKIEVSPKATIEEMMPLITTDKGTITFTSEDLLLICAVHNNALYLTITCLQKQAPLPLVDNGTMVNICPWRMAKRLGIKEEQLSAPSTHLRAYDNPKRLVLGTIYLPINVGPIKRNIEFQVLDVPSTLNLLLGRP